jgi:ubiquinol-cytochrome c reductase subunit 7
VFNYLINTGLLYEDLYYDDIAEEARSMMPRELQVARFRRLSRAFDLSFKRQYMSEEFQRNWDPMREYLAPYYAEVEAIKQERELLNRS